MPLFFEDILVRQNATTRVLSAAEVKADAELWQRFSPKGESEAKRT